MSTETIRFIRDGENWGKEVWRWRKKDSILYIYIPIATLSPPE